MHELIAICGVCNKPIDDNQGHLYAPFTEIRPNLAPQPTGMCEALAPETEMTTGPQHYSEAERLLADVRKAQVSMTGKPSAEHIAQFLAQAQVHATLALAAATALRVEYPEYTRGDDSGWAAVAGSSSEPESHYRHKSLPRWEDRSGMCVKCGADSADGSCTIPD